MEPHPYNRRALHPLDDARKGLCHANLAEFESLADVPEVYAVADLNAHREVGREVLEVLEISAHQEVVVLQNPDRKKSEGRCHVDLSDDEDLPDVREVRAVEDLDAYHEEDQEVTEVDDEDLEVL
ncbi:unnamed protein product [Angiostrongylus costaricensis]|uniref:50S ribosomal protein L25 n=1 Tax=Angiostrongylus costaricensis TaxID=334426 RepID=A0A0R3PM74_ANGCS|nr:unnamed protein product [Angiostrongylus costaricensis]